MGADWLLLRDNYSSRATILTPLLLMKNKNDENINLLFRELLPIFLFARSHLRGTEPSGEHMCGVDIPQVNKSKPLSFSRAP
jgi:hypothetical protein